MPLEHPLVLVPQASRAHPAAGRHLRPTSDVPRPAPSGRAARLPVGLVASALDELLAILASLEAAPPAAAPAQASGAPLLPSLAARHGLCFRAPLRRCGAVPHALSAMGELLQDVALLPSR